MVEGETAGLTAVTGNSQAKCRTQGPTFEQKYYTRKGPKQGEKPLDGREMFPHEICRRAQQESRNSGNYGVILCRILHDAARNDDTYAV